MLTYSIVHATCFAPLLSACLLACLVSMSPVQALTHVLLAVYARTKTWEGSLVARALFLLCSETHARVPAASDKVVSGIGDSIFFFIDFLSEAGRASLSCLFVSFCFAFSCFKSVRNHGAKAVSILLL